MQAWHIARRDLRAAAAAPLLWLMLAAWLAVVHGAFALTLWEVHGRSGALSTPLYINALWWGALVLALFAPAATMNAWASERAQGTWQLLLTLPLAERDLVLGKFLASWGLLLVLILATLGMPLTLAVISAVSLPHAIACYVGLLCLSAFLAALGVWIGALVEGPVAAFVLSFGVIAVLWLAGVGGADGPLGPLAAVFGLGERIAPLLAGRLALADVAWFLAGAGACLLLAEGALRAQRQSSVLPWWRRAGLAGGPALAIIAALALAVIAAQRSGLALDLSADRRFTLAPALSRILAHETETVQLIGVWRDSEAARFAAIADLAEAAARIAPRGRWQRLDPERHRPQIADLEARHGPLGAPALWVLRGARAQRIALHAGSRITLQRDLAGALLQLADPEPSVVHILQGHGELRLDARGDDGCRELAGVLRASGFQVASYDAAAPPPPPRDVIAVLGPTAPLGSLTLSRLEAHLRDGGGLLVLADDRAPRDLGAWLRRRGVLIAGAAPLALVEQQRLESVLEPDPPTLPPRHLVSLSRHVAGAERELPHHNLLLRGSEHLHPAHPLTAPLLDAGLQLLSPFTGPCEALPPSAVAAAGTPPFEAIPLLATLRGDAWERARGEPLAVPRGLEQAPARWLAWALSYEPAPDAAAAARGARLVVWGSRQAASDSVIAQAAYANGTLLAAACRWLAHREPPPEVPQAELQWFQVDISDRGLEILVLALAVGAPLLALGGALLAWFDQRR
ncbi:MAG: ABC transporter permease subunit [Planctomycetota bacterium]|nr:ABC transporter permease subunit [Planctomycetota bacterium]MDW8373773.1 ABC transporter permease subunit [Planctomycetota bacterium]